MCRLLGIVANKPVDLEFSLYKGHDQTLESLSHKNPDGWGIAWYKDGAPAVHKEPVAAVESEHYRSVVQHVRSSMTIAHVRKSTGTAHVQSNTHPFAWQNWAFAHNGCVERAPLFEKLADIHRRALEGKTDSEVLFRWILQCIEEKSDIIAGIRNALGVARALDHSGLNFLLTDGRSLYAAREASRNEDYYSLYYLDRDPGTISPLTLKSSETDFLLQSKSLNGEKAVLVCSERLTEDEAWKCVPMGHVLTVGNDLSTKLQKVV